MNLSRHLIWPVLLIAPLWLLGQGTYQSGPVKYAITDISIPLDGKFHIIVRCDKGIDSLSHFFDTSLFSVTYTYYDQKGEIPRGIPDVTVIAQSIELHPKKTGNYKLDKMVVYVRRKGHILSFPDSVVIRPNDLSAKPSTAFDPNPYSLTRGWPKTPKIKDLDTVFDGNRPQAYSWFSQSEYIAGDTLEFTVITNRENSVTPPYQITNGAVIYESKSFRSRKSGLTKRSYCMVHLVLVPKSSGPVVVNAMTIKVGRKRIYLPERKSLDKKNTQ